MVLRGVLLCVCKQPVPTGTRLLEARPEHDAEGGNSLARAFAPGQDEHGPRYVSASAWHSMCVRARCNWPARCPLSSPEICNFSYCNSPKTQRT